MKALSQQLHGIVTALLYVSAVGVLLFALRSIESGTIRYWFLLWNLVLAWLPLLFALWLRKRLVSTPWLSWRNLVLSGMWLGFLPNSFYLVSDLIHLHSSGEVSLLYDAVMFCAFIFAGFIVGMMSTVIVHLELVKRLGWMRSRVIIASVLLAASFAIHLGRSLRWNTWDVLVNPAGILFDVSERVINPTSYDQAFITTGIFFLLLSSIYMVAWRSFHLVRSLK